jgi:hypothetical protein
MKQFFLFLLLSATTFAVAQESVTLIDFNTQNQFRILLINSSRNSSLQQISNNQGKVTFRGIPALDGYQVVLMEPLYLPVKIRFIECAFESSVKKSIRMLGFLLN